MPLRAVGLDCMVVGAVPDFVQVILASGVVPQVLQAGVGPVAVLVADFRAIWSWPHECQHYQLVDQDCGTDVGPEQVHSRVSLAVCGGLQDSPPD